MRLNKTTFNKKYLYTCLVFLSFSLIALKDKKDIKYVRNLGDFKTHTANHSQNVYSLGMHLYYQYRHSHFSDVPEHVIREKLMMHDYEKLASAEDLRDLGYTEKLSIIERLYEHFGENKDNSKNGEQLKSLIQELNTYAKHYDEAVYRKYGYINSKGELNSIAQKISLIEKIADVVEREKNPITPEEIGLPKARNGKEYVKGMWQRHLTENLAKLYHQIVQPNPLIYIAKNYRSAPSCKGLFN